MEITERFFLQDGQWNVIHLPYKPNGFGVFILGDRTHFVDDQSSFWIQHYGRNQLLSTIRREGYTLFQSNLFGKNWGSETAVTYAKQLIHVVLKKEILNEKIHLIAEGMGGLIALELMESIPEKLRSVAMFNPCLDLQTYISQEKENKFFYKHLVKELSNAYNIDEKELDGATFKTLSDYESLHPVRIWQRMTNTPYSYQQHSRKYEDQRKNTASPIELTFHLADNPYRVNQSVVKFFKAHEKNL
ncbi:lipase family protein [Metabacillus arenae]|uniref:Hydrolase n=1 Tax=Metabacillus arenae TaxID=2771434 RepID=A0A926NLU3_9BACI|nr:hypothetical protein [Metabacillus arenae]MBD1383455.1 hypothetical protein [Metabacillus arenae]